MRPMLCRSMLCLASLAGGCGAEAGDVSAPPPANLPPVAAFGDSCVELACSFTDASTDTDGQVSGYRWSFGDGSADQVTRDAEHAYAAPGTYIVVHPVSDDKGATASHSQSVKVSAPPNLAPVAFFAPSCVDLTCTFDDFSYDPDGSVTGHRWTFGDGAEDSVAAPAHTYASAGSYDVGLTVTDARGMTAGATGRVIVTPPGSPAIALNRDSLTLCIPSSYNRACLLHRRTFHIASTGSVALTWKASVSERWIVVTPTQGTTPSDVTVTLDPWRRRRTSDGLITISAPSASNSPQTIAVQVEPF